jgi:hypothetical protein
VGGKQHGQCKATCVNGDIYEGQWVGFGRKGQGKMMYVNGDIYEGHLVERECHGRGKMTYVNGDIYEGEWVEGKPCGQGKKTWAHNGNTYDGTFQDGEAHGTGTLMTSTTVCSGKWIRGSIRVVRGTYTSADGIVWRGTWETRKSSDSDKDDHEDVRPHLPSIQGAVLHGECVADHPDKTRSRFSAVCGRADKFRNVTVLVAGRVNSVRCLWSDDAYTLLLAASSSSAAAAATSVHAAAAATSVHAAAAATSVHAAAAATSVHAAAAATSVHAAAAAPAAAAVSFHSAATSAPAASSFVILGPYEALCFFCSKVVNTNKKHRTVGCKRGSVSCHTHCLGADQCDTIKTSNRCPVTHKGSSSVCHNPHPACNEMRNLKDVMRCL